jgi:hypothetical protein
MQREWEIQRQNLEKAKRKAANINPEDTSLQEGPGKGVTGGALSRSSSQESMTQNLGNVTATVPISMAVNLEQNSRLRRLKALGLEVIMKHLTISNRQLFSLRLIGMCSFV